jgi:hypothetical protein
MSNENETAKNEIDDRLFTNDPSVFTPEQLEKIKNAVDKKIQSM